MEKANTPMQKLFVTVRIANLKPYKEMLMPRIGANALTGSVRLEVCRTSVAKEFIPTDIG